MYNLSINFDFPTAFFIMSVLQLIANLENVELQVLFEQMLDFTGFSSTRFLNLPLAYHSFLLHKIRYSFHLIRQRTFSYMAIQIHRYLQRIVT